MPDYAIVVGVPAKQKGWACKCGEPLQFKEKNVICKNCSSEYGLEEDNLIIIKEAV